MPSRTLDDAMADATRAAARLAEATAEPLSWEWDSRLSAVLSAIEAPRHLPVLELVGALFPATWDHRTLSTAPELVRKIASAWGGLSSGQRLFTLEPEDDPLFFAAWWPWGDGTTFSLRISCVARGAAAKGRDPLAQLRRWFSV
jgi:hypothetical protein